MLQHLHGHAQQPTEGEDLQAAAPGARRQPSELTCGIMWLVMVGAQDANSVMPTSRSYCFLCYYLKLFAGLHYACSLLFVVLVRVKVLRC